MARKDTNQMSLFGGTAGEISMTARGFEFVSRGGSEYGTVSVWQRGTLFVKVNSWGTVTAEDRLGVPVALSSDDLLACLTMLDEVMAMAS